MPLVLISGALANKPFNGGNAWSRLSWVQGFQKLGFEVFFLEQLGHDSCVDGTGQISPFRTSINLRYFKDVMDRFGLGQACSLIYRDGEEVYGLPMTQIVSMANRASLLFNFSGHLTLPEI